DPDQLELPFEPTPFTWRDPGTIKRRSWLYAKHLIRQYVSATVGRRGQGKTTRAIAELLSLVTGRDILDVGEARMPDTPLRVWYMGEDPRGEIDRRIAAACVPHGIPERDIGGRLFFDSALALPIDARKIATIPKGTTVARNKPVIEAFKAGMQKR